MMKKSIRKIFVLSTLLVVFFCNCFCVHASELYHHVIHMELDKGEEVYYEFDSIYPYVYVRYDKSGFTIKVFKEEYLSSMVLKVDDVENFVGYSTAYNAELDKYHKFEETKFYNGFSNVVIFLEDNNVDTFSSDEEASLYYLELIESKENIAPPTSDNDLETEKKDNGIAGELVNDLIGSSEEFTPQSIMSIFVICLTLECLSHIASALLSVGGMK